MLLNSLGKELREVIFNEKPLDIKLTDAFDEHAGAWVERFSHTNVEKIYKQTCPIDKSFFPLKNEIEKFIKLKECDDKKISDFISKLVKLDTTVSRVTNFVSRCIK